MANHIRLIILIFIISNLNVYADESKLQTKEVKVGEDGVFNVQDLLNEGSNGDDTGDETDGESSNKVKVNEEDLLNAEEDPMLLSDSDLQHGESHQYQAEVSRLLDIIVNSLYTTKEVFLRELVSNSADALEKYKILGFKNKYTDVNDELFIKIRVYPKKKMLTIHDNGIGMTRKDLMNNLGTIAKSGTANFLDLLAKGGDSNNLIGQFGVGFYSAFLVADSVVVQSKYPGEKQHVWKSSADNNYQVYEDPKGNTLGEHGTLITLFLKEDSTDYLKNNKLESLVRKYSQFVRFPIYLYKLENDQVCLHEDTRLNLKLMECNRHST